MAKPKPREELRTFSVRVPETLYEDVLTLATRSGVPLNTYVAAWLTEAVERGILVEERRDYALKPTDPAYLAFLQFQQEAALQQSAADLAASEKARKPITYRKSGRGPDPDPTQSARLNEPPAPPSPNPKK